MIVDQDLDCLLKMLGANVVPEAVEAEYELRAGFLHTAGSGALGAIGCIDLLRYLGYVPKRLEKPDVTDWEKLPSDGSVLVMAGPFFGAMQPGRFKGFVHSGTLAIELEGGEVRECRPGMVVLRDTPTGKPALLQQGTELKEVLVIKKGKKTSMVWLDGQEKEVDSAQLLEV